MGFINSQTGTKGGIMSDDNFRYYDSDYAGKWWSTHRRNNMDRFEEIKDEWEYGKKNGLTHFLIIKEDMDWFISEIERLKKLVKEAYEEGYFYAAEDLPLDDAWDRATVRQELKK